MSLASTTEHKKQTHGHDNTGSTNLVNKDRGHRFGNFHNYYNFNPTHERLRLLEKSGGILDYVAKNWKPTRGAVIATEKSPSAAGGDSQPKAKKPKLMSKAPRDTDSETVEFVYLDIGCNEGDLTMDVAKALSARLANRQYDTCDDDSSTKRISLTMSANGVDLDPVLIERAQSKYQLSSEQSERATECKRSEVAIESNFQVSNVLSNPPTGILKQEFNMTSIFSTTMWIHINGGDEGLRRVLKNICDQTRDFVLIEPQPSKCYRTAMIRLRKMGQPEFDVSSERLTLRPNIEDEIDKIMQEHSFRRVVDPCCGCADAEGPPIQIERTAWNRSLWLYERVCPNG